MMTSCNEVTTCEDISKEYALSVGQSATNSNYPTMPKPMMKSCDVVNTCEDISSGVNQSNYPTMPKSMSTPCKEASTRKDISIKTDSFCWTMGKAI